MTKKPQSILLSFDLFIDFCIYVYRHAEMGDLQYERIVAEVDKKIEAMVRHYLYTIYKTGGTKEERNRARIEYLDSIGLLESFRWDPQHDINVENSESSW